MGLQEQSFSFARAPHYAANELRFCTGRAAQTAANANATAVTPRILEEEETGVEGAERVRRETRLRESHRGRSVGMQRAGKAENLRSRRAKQEAAMRSLTTAIRAIF